MAIPQPKIETPFSEIEKSFQEIQKKVFKKRPVLEEVIFRNGQKTLFEYAEDYLDVNLNPPILKRQVDFITTFKSEVKRLLGSNVAEAAAKQLAKYYFVSTADHHGPICHPFFINTNIMTMMPYFTHKDTNLDFVIVLSCANISLNNSSFPRGLVFNSFQNGNSKMHRLSFLPSNAHSSTVYNFRAYTSEEIQKVKNVLREKVLNKELNIREKDLITEVLDSTYNTPDALQCENFSDQITKTNFSLWRNFFPYNKVKKPDLIYIEQESLVMKLICDHHLDEDTTISRVLFNKKYDDIIIKYFDGMHGAFSVSEKIGTYLFWGVSDAKNYRVQLWKNGNYLMSDDESTKIELTPESIRVAIEKKQIIPSMMLIFMVLSFYYGLKCLGGFSQINYLTHMKNAYIKMQADLEAYRSIEVCARAQTKELGGDLVIAYLGEKKENGIVVPATGLDLILYGNENTWEYLMEMTKELTLYEAISPMMPEFYKIIYPEKERDDTLCKVSGPDIAEFLELNKKIKLCAHFPTVENVN
ncbi:MAG: hypothetical protein WCJ84_03350 [Candidatus Peregrinibacteria bacterium]